MSNNNYYQLAENIKLWATELGFDKVGISGIDLTEHEPKLKAWLENGFHGDMHFMTQHGNKRTRPDELLPGTVSVVSVRLDYLPSNAQFATTLSNSNNAYISRYALGRDYHKVIRNKLKQLGKKIEAHLGEENLSFRPFVDSAPVLERPLAEKAGLGWVGKHSLLLDENAGSWFFLGELFLPIELPTDQPKHEECGQCVACMTICPTQAIVEPYVVDSRRCISYLTIENKGAIPHEFRKAIGNRIYGCDDCQLICPWNRESKISNEPDFKPKSYLHNPELLALWNWTEDEFLDKLQGSPIRRIGYESWLRNIAVALGNADFKLSIVEQLSKHKGRISEMLDEHIDWALEQQEQKSRTHPLANRQLKRLIKAIEIGLPRDA